MARAIDCEIAKKRLQAWIDESEAQGFEEAARNFRDCISLLDAVPTLTPPNEPLTLEQLREMEGQPVWVKCLKPNKYINPPVRWRILEKSIMGTFGVWDGESCLSERDYGTDWLAYRRPPEGES